MAEKEAIMVLKVDLQCYRCYKKVKKVLSKLPQIRDQIYDEKANTVIVTVVCCSPEKIRDKLCYKGGGSIKSIEIKPATKPKEPEKKKPENPKEPEKKQPEKKVEREKPKEAEKKPADNKPREAAAEKKPADNKPKEAAEKPKVVAAPLMAYPPPIGFSSTDRYYGHDHGAGPCYIGRPVYDSWGGGGGGGYGYSYGIRGDYLSEENPQGCSIM